MKLYGHDTSPYVRRVRALLLELDLPFERDRADWLKPSPDFLKASPIGKLPVLVVEENGADLTLLDSKAIAEFLLARHGTKTSSGAGASGADRAAATSALPFQPTLFTSDRHYEDQNVLTVIDAALDAAIALFVFERDGVKRESAPYLVRQATRVDNCLEWLDAHFARRLTLHDGAFAFVDLALMCCLDWLAFRNAQDFTRHENLTAFYENNRPRASLVATDPRRAG